jgi:hypothetical protein
MHSDFRKVQILIVEAIDEDGQMLPESSGWMAVTESRGIAMMRMEERLAMSMLLVLPLLQLATSWWAKAENHAGIQLPVTGPGDRAGGTSRRRRPLGRNPLRADSSEWNISHSILSGLP